MLSLLHRLVEFERGSRAVKCVRQEVVKTGGLWSFYVLYSLSLISHKDGLSNNCIDQKWAISEEIILSSK